MSLSALNPHDPCVRVLRRSPENECWLASLCQAKEGVFVTFPLHTTYEVDCILIHIFSLHSMC